MNKNIKNYPPVGSPDRLEEIMNRGAGMRRRRQLVGATSAGVMGIACLVLVLTLGTSTKPVEHNVAAAPEGKNTQVAPESDTDTPATPPTTTPIGDRPFVSWTVDDAVKELRIEVNDAEMPVPADASALAETSYDMQQCVLVNMTRTDDGTPFAAEAFACRTVTPADTTPQLQTVFELSDATQVAVGCPAVEERLDQPIDMTTTEASTQFATSVAPSPDGLPAGEYSITITAISGTGDGCPGGDGSTTAPDPESGQVENIETVTGTFTVA